MRYFSNQTLICNGGRVGFIYYLNFNCCSGEKNQLTAEYDF